MTSANKSLAEQQPTMRSNVVRGVRRREQTRTHRREKGRSHVNVERCLLCLESLSFSLDARAYVAVP